jgi:hypothetical protein
MIMERGVSNKNVKKVSQEEEEKLLIFSKADDIKGEQLIMTDNGIITENELKKFALGEVDNPERKYELYYKGIMKLLRKFLPSGPSNRKLRSYVYEEKNTFLTRGKRLSINGIRGGDSRMAYIKDTEELLNVITAWIVSSGTPVQLYNSIRELNISRGYGSSKE